MSQSLPGEDAHIATVGCQKLLESYEIKDVEVELRESVFARFVSTSVLSSSNPSPPRTSPPAFAVL